MKPWRVLTVVLLVLAPALVVAAPLDETAPLQFRNAAEEARFHALTAELRCVQCQNQSVADSNAPIAHDVRRQVLALMQQGRSDADIQHYLVERYGEFVLYRPRVEPATWLLWFGPGLLLVGAAALLAAWIRRRNRGQALHDDEEEQEW
ncbi:cytochrome c-type biogenesis protein [Xanthomonas massiliensis]|uniref:cytochrome c-type biogenesis protein n=1 Tax=Xanthomonas massiliensis TaxID=1720302 RepID=UPI0008269E88|nr:cytochrome c-type biogenesis protein [Xanthomonas massiliensis]